MTDPIRFGRAELRSAERLLLLDGQPAPIGARAFDVLALLVAQRDRVVGKDELLAAAWPGVVVEENNLQVQISALRKLLGAAAITTVAGQGYQFTAAVGDASGSAPPAASMTGAPASPAAAQDEVPRPDPVNRWVARIVWLLALAAVAYSVWTFTRERPQAASDRGAAVARGDALAGPSVAVLPFIDLSEKKDQEYFSDGLSESLIDRLARIPNLRVPARTSCFYFKGRSEDVTEIARRLRVSHVLEGSVRRSGNAVRVTAQLVRADNGYHVWSETFDRNMTDIFKVQDELAGSVAAALSLSMRPASVAAEPPPASIDAYNLLLQARFALARFDPADVRRAVDLFEQSARLDPDYAAAWSGIAVGRRWLADYADSSPADNVARAREAAARALALNPDSVEAHVALAVIHQNYDFDWTATEAELATAERLDPANFDLRSLRAYRAMIRGDAADAVRQMESLLDIDPMDAGQYRFQALALLTAGRAPEAERAMRRGLEVSPAMSAGNYTLVRALVAQKQYAEAAAAARQEPDGLYRRTALAIALHLAGQETEARTSLDELIARDADGAAFQIAEVYAARGEREMAVKWLQRAYRQHDSGLLAMRVNNFLRPIAGDPRFIELEARVGLPPRT